MSQWSSAKAKRVLAALLRIGWSIKRESSSHKTLTQKIVKETAENIRNLTAVVDRYFEGRNGKSENQN
jgi:hypothetical protein